jgi:hypothetical protein
MATGVIGSHGNRRSDDIFFSGMAVIILVSTVKANRRMKLRALRARRG